MRLTRQQVLEVIHDAEQQWTGHRDGDPAPRTTYQRGPLAAVVSEQGAVITVLWRKQEQWSR